MSAGIARAFALFTGSSMLGSLTQVAKGKLTAVVLGTAGVGVLNQLTSVWSLFSVLASMGFYSGMVRHMAGRWADGDENGFRSHLSSSAAVLLFSSVAVTLLGCVLSAQVSHFVFQDAGERADLVCLILLAVPVFCLSQVYRASLNAAKSVSFLVRARVAADVASVLILAVLIYPFGLRGAILAFIGLHLLYMALCLYYAKRAVGARLLTPAVTDFKWVEVRRNVGYGVNGLLTVTVGILTSIVVSRWIIGALGAGENGIYAMGLKVATLFLGGLSAAATGHYFPTLAAARSEEDMHGHIDETLALYFYIIPPIVLMLMVTGDVLMHVMFSADFVPAAVLLLLILPGDLFRVIAETLGVPLLVRRKLTIQAALYLVWAACFLALASLLLPKHGTLGVAAAYLLSQALHGALVFFALRWTLGYRMSLACGRSVALGFALIFGAAWVMWGVAERTPQLLVAACLLSAWCIFSYRDPRFAALVHRAARKVRR